MTTLHVTTTFSVDAGQTFAFDGEQAFGVNDQGSPANPTLATLLNFGTITVDDAPNGWPAAFVLGDNATFWNEAGGSVSVTGDDGVEGLYGDAFYSPTEFHNSGQFSVTATDGSALGVYGEGTKFAFNNDGTFSVNATDEAIGAHVTVFGTVNNSGVIDVEGGTAAIAMDLYDYTASFVNSGTIIARADDPLNSYAFFMTNVPSEISITNSGTIEGQIYLEGAAYGHALLTNTSTGHIVGNIEFTDVSTIGYGNLPNNDIVHNDGTICGFVDLGTGDDSYDGSGTVSGPILGGDGNDTITTGGGNDFIFGDGVADFGGDGDDTIHAGAGNDYIIGGGGTNLIDGGTGNDTAGYDTADNGVTVSLAISGPQATGAGTDTLVSIENLSGSYFDDTLTGNGASNVITGGAGNDHLDGGGGIDTAAYSGVHSDYSMVAGRGFTTITDLRDGSPDGTDITTSFEKYQFADGTFVYDNTGAAVGTVTDTGTAPWSSIVTNYDVLGSPTAQAVFNDNGSEVVTTYDPSSTQGFLWKVDSFDSHGHLATESGEYANGKHWLTINDTANDFAWRTAIVTFDSDWNLLSVRGVNDDNTKVVSASSVTNALDIVNWFTTPYDPDFGSTPGTSIQAGGSENDVLFGHGGCNYLTGAGGDDLLVGGTGENTLTGGAGNDHFVFTAGDYGVDVVTDFTAGDTIELHGYGIANFAELQSMMSQYGSDVVITIDPWHYIDLQSTTVGQFQASDFQLT